MATKHYFPDTAANTLVPLALRALVTANPHLTLNAAERVVANAYHDPSKVAIISGGGSGHEPAWSGFVGEGLLSAAACGDIFASPSTKQILAAVSLAPSTKGTIMLITNYTGDRLHFGLAAERAKAFGLGDVVVLPATDDVSIGRSKSNRVGRRGMPGHVFTMKTLCAAAAQDWSLEQCMNLGRAVNDQTVSIGTALDHCHVPGRRYQSIPDHVCVVGAGIHNEPGQQLVSPFPSVEELIKRCLDHLCSQDDPERAFVQFGAGDEVLLLINNYGGLSPLELGALTEQVQQQLASSYSITPVRCLSGSFETSLNAPGFSISLCNFSAAAKHCQSTTSKLLELFDRPTTAVSWPSHVRPTPKPALATRTKTNGEVTKNLGVRPEQKYDVIDASLLERAVRKACERAILAEPQLTKWDMVMGDGDCGEAVEGLCKSVLQRVDSGSATCDSVVSFLESITEAVDDMGGTLGAIFGIFLTAFITALKQEFRESTGIATPEIYASALGSAVEALKSHTTAREGDRTVMDVLLPFTEKFVESRDLEAAVAVAQDRAEATQYLEARLGRASYVGEGSGQQLPDPGAWALYEILAGVKDGLY
ncbi:hypothetical protein CDV31_016293 [Fusarium ambrosium]|uniref:Dihydroxyacetone kinase n=1 Tax=Fusarium ambrosium TaxID=131363 RepID=A0A428SBU7_9HYPO|nr:hypothetical protein CDV31_016293 [Fusarium ambrosium]